MNEIRDDKERGAFRIHKSPFTWRINRLNLVGVLLGIAFFTFVFFWRVRVDDIKSWETLEKQLHAELVVVKVIKGLEPEHFRESSAYCRLKNWGDEELWFAMLMNDNRKYPFVTLAGYYCIKVNNPSMIRTAAFTALSDGWNHSYFWTAPLLPEIEKPDYSKDDFNALNKYMMAEVSVEVAVVVDIPLSTLKKWFYRKGSSRVPTHQFLFAIETLINSNPSESEKSVLDDLILELSKTPGYPRRFYVLYGDEKTNYYRQCMKQVIGDDTFTRWDMSTLFYFKESYIKNNYDSVMANASAARVRQFDEMVARHKFKDE